MDVLKREDIAALADPREGPCASIYMPAHRGGNGTEQDPIRFKNLLRRVEGELGARGWSPPAVCAFIDPATRLRLDHEFWKHQGDGLAAFLAPGLFRTFRLPAAFPEEAVVSHRFHLKPLMTLFDGDGSFLVLALGREGVRLWRGDRYGMEAVPLPGVPQGMAETLQFDVIGPRRRERDRPELGAGAAGGGPGRHDPVVRSQAFGAEVDKQNVRRYFEDLDNRLQPLLKDERSPLVLAGVEYLLPIFRETSRYARFVQGAVTGPADARDERELHRRAWEIARPVFDRAREGAADDINRLAKTGRSSRSLYAIVPAAVHGRVAVLFAATDERRWGRFDPEHDCVILHREERPGDDDLLDFCAVRTWLNGGVVHAVERARIPGRTRLAALFRY